MTSTLLSVRKLGISFYQEGHYLKAVDDIDFDIQRGETVALLGESGCGKSITSLSLLQLLPTGAYAHKHSQVLFDGQDVLTLSELQMRHIRGKRMAMIFQEPMSALNPVLSIHQQLAEVLTTHGMVTTAAIDDKIVRLLELVELPDAKARMLDYPHQFSGGQKQRIMIAMAIASDPELLIADEPTTALDVTIQAQIITLLKKLQNELSMAILLITHDLGVVKEMADKVCVMYAGRIVERANKEDFFSQLYHPYSQRLLECLPSFEKRENTLHHIPGTVPALSEALQGCAFHPRCILANDVCTAEIPSLAPETSDHWVACHHYKQEITAVREGEPKSISPNSHSTTVLLKAQDIRIHFPIKKGLFKRTVNVMKAVDGVSFEIKQGETLAIVGESGCGKTSLSRGLLQLIPVTAGRLDYRQDDVFALGRRALRKLRRQMQIIFQDPFSSMNPRMMVGDIIMEGMRVHRLYDNERSRVKKMYQVLEQVGLPQQSIDRYPHQFSGGQRQRISIARALVLEPQLLICDEPTSALDVSVQAQILNLLKSLQQELNLSYLFISHDISVVSYLADRILVMQAGKIIEQGSTDKILHAAEKAYTRQLLDSVLR